MRPLKKSFGHTNVKSTYELICHCLVIIAVSLFGITSHSNKTVIQQQFLGSW